MTSIGFDFANSDASSSGVYLVAHEDLAPIDAAASDAGWLVRTLDLRACRDKATVLQQIAMALDIPASWGDNWDALAFCLRDFAWLPARGYVFLFDHAEDLRDSARSEFRHLLDVFDEAGFSWAERAVPFWAFFAMSEEAFEEMHD
jgi:RNAse (barnase) inhibitor barstar